MLILIPISGSTQVLTGKKAAEKIPGTSLLRYSPVSGNLSYIQYADHKKVTLSDLINRPATLTSYALQARDLRLTRSHEDQLGMKHSRFQVLKNGFPVEGSVLILHEKEGLVHSLNGEIFSFQAASAATLSEKVALQKAISHLREEKHSLSGSHQTGSGTLVYAPKNGAFASSDFRLCWKFDVYSLAPLYRAWVYVDAENGELIWESNRIHTADVQATADTRYSGTRAIITDSLSPTQYELFESGRGGGITTRNMLNGFSIGGSVPFVDTDNYWNNVNPQQDEVATDAHLGAEITYDYYLQTFNWNSFDNQGARIRSYVHFSTNYENAFWDGNHVVYGDGGGGTFSDPVVCPEICGHEITHGVTEFSAGLIYAGEPGALNESFSDIFGTVIEAELYPTGWDWVVGTQVTPMNAGIRSMEDPTIHGNPDCYGGPLWIPNNNVHFNSGVQNKWFYLLTVGDADTNALGNAYNVTGIGMDKAAAISFRNLTTYLTPASTYEDARFYAIESAKDLYGSCSAEMIATAEAWYAVGVGLAYSDTPAVHFDANPKVTCVPGETIRFTNLSSLSGSFLWGLWRRQYLYFLQPHPYLFFPMELIL